MSLTETQELSALKNVHASKQPELYLVRSPARFIFCTVLNLLSLSINSMENSFKNKIDFRGF